MFSCDFCENLYFSQFWFQAFFFGPRFFFPGRGLRGWAFARSSAWRSNLYHFGQKIVPFWSKFVPFWSNLYHFGRICTMLVEFVTFWSKFPGRWAKIPGNLYTNSRDVGTNSRDVGNLVPGTLGRWAPNSQEFGTLAGNLGIWCRNCTKMVEIRPRAWNQISKQIKIHISLKKHSCTYFSFLCLPCLLRYIIFYIFFDAAAKGTASRSHAYGAGSKSGV